MTGTVLISFLAALSVSTLLGYLAASFLWPRGLSHGALWAMAPGIGAGICSLIFFVFRRPMFTVEFALLLTLAAVWIFWRRPRLSHSPALWQLPLPCLLLAGAVGFVASGLVFAISQNPHGDWDAFAIWNSHARYLYRDGPAWQEHIQNTFHADYPLLVPAVNARAWRYAGQEIPETGGWLGLVFTLSGVAVLIATLIELRNLRRAMLIGLVLLATPFYLEYGVSQSADVPLSLYFLSTIALLCLYSERASGERGLLVLAGFMAGCAGWTKNEGLIFIFALCIAMLAPVLVGRAAALRRFSAFALGLLLPLAVILFFKVTIAPPSELMSHRGYAEMMTKVLDPDRYFSILTSSAATLWSFGDWAANPLIPLLIFIVVCGVDRRRIRSFGWLAGAGTMAIVLAGYFAVYLLTPFDLKWYLDGSLSRLFLQIWPPALLLAGLVAVQ
jgi:hypothetical protein